MADTPIPGSAATGVSSSSQTSKQPMIYTCGGKMCDILTHARSRVCVCV